MPHFMCQSCMGSQIRGKFPKPRKSDTAPAKVSGLRIEQTKRRNILLHVPPRTKKSTVQLKPESPVGQLPSPPWRKFAPCELLVAPEPLQAGISDLLHELYNAIKCDNM